MAELLVIRHGQASFGADNYDLLSDLGRRQSNAVGNYLRGSGWTPDRVITGSLLRQKATATEMGFGQSIEQHAGFDEYDFHDLLLARFNGQVPDVVRGDRKTHFRTLRDTVMQWQRGELHSTRESWGDFADRVHAARDFATGGNARRVLVVSSGGVIGQMVASCLSAPDAIMMELNLQVKNSSLHRFVFSAGRMMLTEFNATPHVDADPALLSYS